MKKKTYVVPSVKTVNVEMQNCLLTTSGGEERPSRSATISGGTRKGFEKDWD